MDGLFIIIGGLPVFIVVICGMHALHDWSPVAAYAVLAVGAGLAVWAGRRLAS